MFLPELYLFLLCFFRCYYLNFSFHSACIDLSMFGLLWIGIFVFRTRNFNLYIRLNGLSCIIWNMINLWYGTLFRCQDFLKKSRRVEDFLSRWKNVNSLICQFVRILNFLNTTISLYTRRISECHYNKLTLATIKINLNWISVIF